MTKTEAARRLHYLKEHGRAKDNEALEIGIRAIAETIPASETRTEEGGRESGKICKNEQ